MSPDDQTVIGWREFVAFPEWGIESIRAKADTGARTSAIDVESVEELGGDRVRFEVAVERGREPLRTVTVEADLVRRTRIRSSLGRTHDRLVVRTLMRLGPVEKVVELGLVRRHHMLCRVLLGRLGLEPEIVVDSGHRYLFGQPRRRRRKKGTT